MVRNCSVLSQRHPGLSTPVQNETGAGILICLGIFLVFNQQEPRASYSGCFFFKKAKDHSIKQKNKLKRLYFQFATYLTARIVPFMEQDTGDNCHSKSEVWIEIHSELQTRT